MIFAETDRLYLRALQKEELPRFQKLLDVWDVVRWLAVVPYPYTMKDAETFYNDMLDAYCKHEPQFLAMALKSDNLLIGGVGLHPPRDADCAPGDVEIGYWLSHDFWGQGLMCEAARTARDIGFTRTDTQALTATTALNNYASQKVLSNIGMKNTGETKRAYSALRGAEEVFKWRLTREEYEAL